MKHSLDAFTTFYLFDWLWVELVSSLDSSLNVLANLLCKLASRLN